MKRILLLVSWCLLALPLLKAQNTQEVEKWMKRMSINSNQIILKSDGSGNDNYTFWAKDNNLHVTAGSTNAMCYAIGNYLKKQGALHYSWEGTRQVKHIDWADQVKETGGSPFKFRMYMNVCAFGYTTPWWDWKRWEKEIDWMALRGINMPTAMLGQEYVWKEVWNELGVSDDELKNYFTGPAFLPWHRMGNLNGHGGALPIEFMKREMKLQKKVLTRMRDLGMKPVVPAFSGYVPKALMKKYPNAVIREMGQWTPGIQTRTYLLDPKDPLFKEIGALFIKKYQALYGTCEYYLADSFNEMNPPVKKATKEQELREYGKVIYETLAESSPNATWVMQGWMFGHSKGFWTPSAVQAFLQDVPKDKLLIQDFGNDRYDVWKSLNAFYGKQWIFGFVHNYGGTNPVFGDFSFYDNVVTKLLNDPEHGNLMGFGVMPEGIHNNSVVYEYLYDLAWNQQQSDFHTWINQYLKNRYGIVEASMVANWEMMAQSVFKVKYWKPRWWNGAGSYLHNKRPSLKVGQTETFPGDQQVLKAVIKHYMNWVAKYPENQLLAYDLAELSRHYFAIETDNLIKEACKAYQEGNKSEADKWVAKIEKMMVDLDQVAGFHPNQRLYTWCKQATAIAGPKELYLNNAKQQVTVWGGDGLKDYASREWQGLVKDYYWPRWKQFFSALKSSADLKEANSKIVAWEHQWFADNKMPEKPVDYSGKELVKLVNQMFEIK
ncbi:alpha-N-acetylglucosaminidase [Prolixibacteraceae bacterium JC049]|nr:alpha-N-acetylglucosaminidase [Prolixibacteraceae bacterium JC049]